MKKSAYVSADFQADKTHIVIPGPVLAEGRRNRLCRLLIARLLMTAKAPRTIRQPYYSSNTATADLFLFQRGEVEAGRPLAVPGRSHE
jgi:hypothetical protein